MTGQGIDGLATILIEDPETLVDGVKREGVTRAVTRDVVSTFGTLLGRNPRVIGRDRLITAALRAIAVIVVECVPIIGR